MSQEKFTKGKWYVAGKEPVRYCEGKICVDAEDGLPIVIADLNLYFGKEEKQATANLIAAAPEMYELLEDCMLHLFNNTHKDDDDSKDLIKEIINLRKKARGER